MRGPAVFIFLAVVCLLGAADDPQEQETVSTPQWDVIVVTGVYEPVALEEANRSLTVLETKDDEELLSNTVVDFLKLDPSIDLRQRGEDNIQGDLSIRGSTFGQTLVLVDGLRMNDVQTGHHNMNLPTPLSSLERIEVLRGTGSTLYGSDAIGGVVNFVTREPEASEFRIRLAAGNFGRNQQRSTISLVKGPLAQGFTFSRDFSTGFIENRDYRNMGATSRTGFRSRLGEGDVVLASSDRSFGAEQFYGNFNSWERTKTWFASIRQGIGSRTVVSFGFRRNTDLFVLFRDRPQVYTNHHKSYSYQVSIRRSDPVSRNSTLHYGLEGLADGVDSNNLGEHSRGRGAGYLALDVRALRRFSFTLGGRLERYGSARFQFSPSVGVGYWAHPLLKLRASAGRAFRVPSFTDLFYHDPANIGSPDLQPETAWNYEGGVDINAAGRWRGALTIFQRRERNGIDYVRNSPDEIWRATNFQRLRFTGMEAALEIRPRDRQTLEFRYTGLWGAQDQLGGRQSKYVFNYPSHSGILAWQAALPSGLVARTRLGALTRLERDVYAVWDLYLARGRGRIQPFLQVTNLTDTAYQEILGVAMPSRGILGGAEIAVFRGR